MSARGLVPLMTSKYNRTWSWLFDFRMRRPMSMKRSSFVLEPENFLAILWTLLKKWTYTFAIRASSQMWHSPICRRSYLTSLDLARGKLLAKETFERFWHSKLEVHNQLLQVVDDKIRHIIGQHDH